MLSMVKYRLGHWTFVPSAHELHSGPVRVRLQQRASATLALLCERRGHVVTQQDMIERVWGSRQHLSPNSVSIVIGDLRRALDLEPASSGWIETVPKAGYRLRPSAEVPAVAKSMRSRIALVIASMLLVAGAVAWTARSSDHRVTVAIGEIQNATGSEAYAQLIRACNAQLLVELDKQDREIAVREGDAPGSSRYLLVQRWVLWSGSPELVLIATDRQGRTIWSRAIYGPEGGFPGKIASGVRDLTSKIEAHA